MCVLDSPLELGFRPETSIVMDDRPVPHPHVSLAMSATLWSLRPHKYSLSIDLISLDQLCVLHRISICLNQDENCDFQSGKQNTHLSNLGDQTLYEKY